MAVIFVFMESEELRAQELGVNVIRLEHPTIECLDALLDDPMVKIFMPFLEGKEEADTLRANFRNQLVMRKIWLGE